MSPQWPDGLAHSISQPHPEFVMDLLGAYRHGRFCPARWLVWMANWGLSLSGAPVAFEPRGRIQGCPLRAASHMHPCRVAL